MTELTDEVFAAFLKATNIEGVDGIRGGTLYPFNGDNLTQEELTQTAAFTGFKDGYSGHLHRYDVPMGSEKTDFANQEITAKLFEQVTKKLRFSDQEKRDMLGGTTFDLADLSKKAVYDSNYVLGQQYQSSQRRRTL